MKKKDKSRLKMLLVAGFIFMIAMQMGYLTSFGINPIALNPITFPGTEKDVYVKINTKNSISLATCDLIVNMYDADGKFLDTATTTSGSVTFGIMVKTGQHVWLQARQAAPATTTYYLSPLTEFVVPSTDNSISTVSLGTLYVDQVTTTNPTMTIRNGWNNQTIADAGLNAMNTTDTAITITISNSVVNTYYGSEGFVDQVTGDEYLGGVWILWKGTSQQPWINAPDYTASDNTYYYYVWHMNSLPYDANGDISLAQSSRTLSVGANTFTDDASVVIDAFDLFCISDWNAGIYTAFEDAHSVGVTAITTLIA